MLYLDLALDGAVRSSVEASLSLLKTASSSEEPETQAGCLVDLVALCVESVCLTSGSNVELVMILRDYQVAHNCPAFCPKRLHAPGCQRHLFAENQFDVHSTLLIAF